MSGMCNAAPYTGPESFIYVHHHRSDENAAYTLIEKLAREGYRIWYPTPPINADLVSERVSQCTVFMPLYSNVAVQSHDFRKVITAAVLNGCEIAPVFLQDMTLSVGMQLQFDSNHRVNWYSVRETPDVKAAALKACKGEPDSSICVMEREFRAVEEPVVHKAKPEVRITSFVDEEEILQKMKHRKEEREEAQHKAAEEAQRRATEEENRRATEEAQRRAAEEAARAAARRRAERYTRPQIPLKEDESAHAERVKRASATVIIEEALPEEQEKRLGGTVIIEELPPILVRINTGELFEGKSGVTTVGRTEDNDICIPAGTVSSRHLEIISRPDAGAGMKNLIRDCGSSNGTWIDGEKMERGGKTSVESCIKLCLSRQEPCVVIFGELAQQIREKGVLAWLECRETREMKLLLEDEMTFGRNSCWEKGAFNEEHISGEHAVFMREKKGFTIKDISTNGTRINGGGKIPKNIPVKISSGDEIRMGYQNFVFTCIALKEK